MCVWQPVEGSVSVCVQCERRAFDCVHLGRCVLVSACSMSDVFVSACKISGVFVVSYRMSGVLYKTVQPERRISEHPQRCVCYSVQLERCDLRPRAAWVLCLYASRLSGVSCNCQIGMLVTAMLPMCW